MRHKGPSVSLRYNDIIDSDLKGKLKLNVEDFVDPNVFRTM
jgi:hypothetical protein